jgi:hypothetical protein
MKTSSRPSGECSSALQGSPAPRKRKTPNALLPNIPIKDAFAEKNAIERGFWGQYLLATAKKRTGVWSREEERRRTIEVYRRCYEKANEKEPILRDFVAYHTDLVCESPWFAELVKESLLPCDPKLVPARKRILLAIAKGFRAAAHPEPRKNRTLQYSRQEGARIFSYVLRRELAAWALALKDATDEWITEKADRKVEELTTKYPKMTRSKAKLRKLLLTGHHYTAATLIASSTFGVRVRDLEARTASARAVKPPLSR